jgi:hypothetical protein
LLIKRLMNKFVSQFMDKKAKAAATKAAAGDVVRLWLGARSLWLANRQQRFRLRMRSIRYHAIRSWVLAGFFFDRLKSWASRQLTRWTATLISVLVVAFMVAMGSFGSETKIGEFSLASAGIIGAALALVLSLSIIPAQRASESFAMPIVLKLANDKPFKLTFVGLVSTTLLSLLLGTNWSEFFTAKLSLSIQFILLGLSFDILRAFYSATLKLLLPESAVRRLVAEVKAELKGASKAADKVLAVQAAMTGGPNESSKVAHALAIQGARLPNALTYWSDQLEEAAHRFISRRDSSATIEAVAALEMIGREYAELRKKSVNLHIDPNFVFAGPQSDISNVHGVVYEAMLRIINDAVDSKHERIVMRCIDSMGRLAEHSLSVIAATHYGSKMAPLAFNGVFYLDRAAKAALAANMLDATLHCISAIQNVLLKRPPDVDLTGVAETANDTLALIAQTSYGQDNAVTVFRSLEAMLLSAQFEIENDFDLDTMESLLSRFWPIFPYEVVADQRGERRLQTYPLFNLSFRASLPYLVQSIAGKVKSDVGRPHVDPFHNLSEAMEAVRGFYRNLSNIKFSNVLLHKWSIDALSEVCRVLFYQITHPVDGAQNHVDTVVRDLTAQISWMSGLFHEELRNGHVRDATHALAVLGIDAVDFDQAAIAQACVDAISRIAICVDPTDAWAMADAICDIEIIARAADAKGNALIAAYARSKMILPASNTPAVNGNRAEAIQTRLAQLDEALTNAGRRSYRIGDDPVEHLHGFVNRKPESRSS